MEKWDRIHAIRDDVQKALELARTSKLIGGSLDAKVTLYCKGDTLAFVKSVENILPAALIVSQFAVAEGDGGTFRGDVADLSVTVEHAAGDKCARCWTFSDTVGKDAGHPDLCSRCASIVGAGE